jgi:hypothetical protein
LHVKQHISSSWTRTDLHDACLNDAFYAQVRRNLEDNEEFVELDVRRVEDEELDKQHKRQLEDFNKTAKKIAETEKAVIEEKQKQIDELKADIATREALAIITTSKRKKLNQDIKEAKQMETDLNKYVEQTETATEARIMKFNKQQSNETKQTVSGKERSRRKGHVDKKFYLVGGSARWMFGYGYEEVERQIDTFIETIANKKDVLSRIAGPLGKQAVSHILGRNINNQHFIQSRYIACKLALCVEAEFITQATLQPITSSNPSFDGWIFQMEFFFQLRTMCAHELQLELKTTNSSVSWNVPNLVEYRDPSNLQHSSSTPLPGKQNIQVGDWLIPTRWNQACFDALQLQKGSLLVVQVTRAKKYKLKLEYVVAVLDQLQAIGFGELTVEIYVVVPDYRLNEFNINKADVRGKIAGWSVENIKVAGLRRFKVIFFISFSFYKSILGH